MESYRALKHALKTGMLLLTSGMLLTACGGHGVKETLGLQRNAPDEFRVVSKPPLSIPPNFSLRPPKEGGGLEMSRATPEETRQILFSSDSNAVPVGNGEASLLKKAGAERADPHIRTTLERDQQPSLAPEKRGIKRWFMKKPLPQTPDPIVNAKGESDRIKENMKNKQPVTKGETPTITQKSQGWLQHLFSR